MTQKTTGQLLTEFAEYLGQQSKEVQQKFEEKIKELKNDLLGGNVSQDLDTIKELAEALQGIKSGEDGLAKLIQKVTEFKEALEGLKTKTESLDNLDLKAAYERGKNH